MINKIYGFIILNYISFVVNLKPFAFCCWHACSCLLLQGREYSPGDTTTCRARESCSGGGGSNGTGCNTGGVGPRATE